MDQEIVGIWSTVAFFHHDPQDEVLVFLPNGRGIFEFWWWHLSSYHTFSYRIENDLLIIIDEESIQEGEAGMIETTTSTLSFSGRFRLLNLAPLFSYVGYPNPHILKQGLLFFFYLFLIIVAIYPLP